MTTETEHMDFSKVGGAAIQAAITCAADGLQEEEHIRYGWIWELLYQNRFTDMTGVEQLAHLSDEQTLNILRTPAEAIQEWLGLVDPQANMFQTADLPQLTKILQEAHRLANNPEELEKWASRNNT